MRGDPVLFERPKKFKGLKMEASATGVWEGKFGDTRLRLIRKEYSDDPNHRWSFRISSPERFIILHGQTELSVRRKAIKATKGINLPCGV